MCSRDIKLCLFRAYCISFYGIAFWEHFHVSVMKKFEAAYVKCVKMFFELGLPTFNTIVHNAKTRFNNCIDCHSNMLVKLVKNLCFEI